MLKLSPKFGVRLKRRGGEGRIVKDPIAEAAFRRCRLCEQRRTTGLLGVQLVGIVKKYVNMDGMCMLSLKLANAEKKLRLTGALKLQLRVVEGTRTTLT